MEKVILKSANMVNTPGLISWAKNGYRFPGDRKVILSIITEGYGLTPECAHDLLSGTVGYTVNEDAVEFEYEGVPVA